jgi:hypothetical protein
MFGHQKRGDGVPIRQAQSAIQNLQSEMVLLRQ